LKKGVASKTAWNEKKLVDLINASLVFITVINFKYAKEMLECIKEKLAPSTYKSISLLIAYLGIETLEVLSIYN